jgi:hypothetical protein
MAEPNGGIPSTGDPRVDAALERIRGKFQDLEDAMLVQAHLEKRQSESIRGLTEWHERHEQAKREHEEWLKHIQAKLDALTDIVMRREGGPEAS